MEKGKNLRGAATVFGWLARVPTADWSPGDSRCQGPSASLSFRRGLPPSHPLSSSLCHSLSLSFSLPLPHCFLSSHLCQLIFHLPSSLFIQLFSHSFSFTHSFRLSIYIYINIYSSSSFGSSALLTPSVVTVGFPTAVFCLPTLPFCSPTAGNQLSPTKLCPFHTTYLLCKSC